MFTQLALGCSLTLSLLNSQIFVSAVTSFQLTSEPAELVRGVTRDVKLTCAHNVKTWSQITSIARVRLLKRGAAGWDVVAEQTEDDDMPKTYHAVAVSGKIRAALKETFLAAKWDLAGDDTFGVFRCDVIGFDEMANLVMESSSEVTLSEVTMTTDDLLDILKKTKRELKDDIDFLHRDVAMAESDIHELANDTAVDAAIRSLEGKVDSLNAGVEASDEKMEFLSKEDSAIKANLSSLDKEVDSFQAGFESLSGEVGSIKKTVIYNNNKVSSIVNDVSSLQRSVKSVNGNFASVNGELLSLKGDVGSLKNDVVSSKGRVSRLEGDVKSVRGDVSSLKGGLASTDSDIVSLRKLISAIDKNISPLKTEISSVKKSLWCL